MAAPIVLLLSMFGAFQVPTIIIGLRAGHVGGFLAYWVVWGLAIPVTILGWRGLAGMFASRPIARPAISRWVFLLLAAPPIAGFLFVFPTLWPAADERMLVALALYAVVNGTFEEIFWRGLFARVFPNDQVRGLLYPAVAFALWLLIPMGLYWGWSLLGAARVFAVGLGGGLLYGWVAQQSGSIRWTVFSHVLTNLSGIGAFLVFRP